ncbi:MAG: MSCRAMM family adhesin SdrC [Clostridium sp.]|nr:MAG: MSCRAMM family adhesin SdrC [Clostridium sp.]
MEKCDINCDTNKDGKCDLNCDTDKDGKCDLNCDTNNDGKCDLNCDTNKDGKCDLNCDTDGDGICDKKCDTNGDGKCDTNCEDKPDDVDINEGDVYVLTLDSSDYDISNIAPGWTGTKKFKLSNTTDTVQTISMKWINVTNTFTNTNNLYYSVTRNKTKVINNARIPYKRNRYYKRSYNTCEKHLMNGHLIFEFKDTGKNQDIDMGKSI